MMVAPTQKILAIHVAIGCIPEPTSFLKHLVKDGEAFFVWLGGAIEAALCRRISVSSSSRYWKGRNRDSLVPLSHTPAE
jgi:hypothetical protein